MSQHSLYQCGNMPKFLFKGCVDYKQLFESWQRGTGELLVDHTPDITYEAYHMLYLLRKYS